MTTWVAAWLLGAVAVAVVASATTGENVDTAFSGCVWTMLLVGLVVGMIWAFGAWVAGG
ncbi:MAG: hypothetical protein M3R38_28735 [Actinomycetota bacterium]|nr:hypothetical protein [Actinomycetota bacterium]